MPVMEWKLRQSREEAGVEEVADGVWVLCP